MRITRRRVVPLAAALLAVVLLGATTSEDAAVLEGRRHAIEMLSQTELNQLKRNYEKYLKLSPERRLQLTNLHDELEQDAKSGGHLQKLLDQYNAWLFKLSPFDREKLLGTADPGERAQLVQKLLEEQKQRSARASRPLFPQLALRIDSSGPVLSTSDLDAIVEAVEQNFLKDQVKKRTARELAPRDHHLQVFRKLMEQLRLEREAGTKMYALETTLVKAMLDVIPNQAVKSRITRSGVEQQIRKMLGQTLARSILAEWKAEIDETQPTSAQIDQSINRWLASSTVDKQAIESRMQTEGGRKFVAAVVALQTNPRLNRQRQVVAWLLRVFPSAPGGRRAGRAGGQGGAASKASAPEL